MLKIDRPLDYPGDRFFYHFKATSLGKTIQIKPVFADVFGWYNTVQSLIVYMTYAVFPDMNMSIDTGTGTIYPLNEAASQALRWFTSPILYHQYIFE